MCVLTLSPPFSPLSLAIYLSNSLACPPNPSKSDVDLELLPLANLPTPNPKPQVANLEDIISERGACGVGFIANLENKASHQIVKDALCALGCMEHRGGYGGDNDSGDGSGLMTSIPWDLFDNWANKQGIVSFDKLHTGVGMVFLPKDEGPLQEAKKGDSFFILKSLIPEFCHIVLVLSKFH